MNKDNKKKILIISRKYPPSTGGMQTYSKCLVENLSKKYDVAPIVLGKSQVHLLWFLPYAALVSFLKLLFSGYKVVYLCDGLLAPLGLFLKVFLRAKVMVTVHGLDITYRNSFYQAVVPVCIARLDKIVCVSKNTLKLCVEKGVDEDKCIFIPNGIEASDIKVQQNVSSGSLNRLYDLMGGNTCGKKILLTVGRLVERKGIGPFINDIFSRLEKDFVYFIAGEGPLKQDIEELIFMKGIKGVHLLGRVGDAELEALYENANAFIMPNIHVNDDPEGFGIVAIEAAYRGVPVIAYDVDGINDAVIDGQTGWLIEQGDTETFIEKIKEPILKKEAVIFASRKFEWSNLVETYLREINRLVSFDKEEGKKEDKQDKNNTVSCPVQSGEQDRPINIFSVTMTPISFPFDDGPKNIVYWIAQMLDKVKFYFISSSSRDDLEKYDNMVFIHSPFQQKQHHSMSFMQRIFVTLAMLINLPKIDIFQFFFTPNKNFSFFWGKILKITGKKSLQVVSSIHTLEAMQNIKDIKSVLNSDVIITHSEYSKKILMGLGVQNVKTVYPGIYPERYDPDNIKGFYPGLDPKEDHILYPGNYGLLQQAFSFEEFLSMIKIICARKENIKFVMSCRIRTDRDVMLEGTFKKLANEYNVADKIVYFNTIEDMPLLMSSCRIGILPAGKNMVKILEIPLVILEMCALGKPFIYGNVRPLEELKEKGIGYFPGKNTKKEFVNLILQNLENSKKEDFTNPLRESVLTNFSVEKQSKEFEKIYYDLYRGNYSV